MQTTAYNDYLHFFHNSWRLHHLLRITSDNYLVYSLFIFIHMNNCDTCNHSSFSITSGPTFSTTMQIGTKVDDLGWPWSAISSNFLGISRDFAHFRGNNGKTNEDRPVLSTMHRLRWCIAGHSSAMGLQSQYSERKWRFFSFMRQSITSGPTFSTTMQTHTSVILSTRIY